MSDDVKYGGVSEEHFPVVGAALLIAPKVS